MIGVFDSGSGGLTVLRPLRERLPHADIIYFGDIRNAPYGNRPHEELTELTVQAIGRLRAAGATRIISACNSVSASLSLSLFDMLELAPDRLIEMVGPTAAAFKDSNERILLVATAATIRSQIYQSAFRMIGKELQTLALPELAGAVEAGESEERLDAIVRTGLATVPKDSFDTIVLSCTHYPLALESFRKVLPDARIVDPGDFVAARAARDWAAEEQGEGTLNFMVSEDSAPFRALVTRLFPGIPYRIEVIEGT